MNKKITSALLLLCFLGSGTSLIAQLKYWVKFKDKNGTPYSISNPSAFLTQESIFRRSNFNIPLDATDLPVTPAYISQVDGIANVDVLYASKWLNGVVVSVPNASVVTTISTLSFVLNNTPVNRYKLTLPKVQAGAEANSSAYLRTAATTSTGYNYGGSYWQNHQLSVDCLHEQGMRGQGIVIAVLDVGFNKVDQNPYYDTLRAYGNIKGTRDFVSGGTNVYDDGDHGEEVLSCMAANVPGLILGSAPMASYWLLRTEDDATEHLVEEYNWIRGAEFADSVGARILTTSLGYTTFDNNLPATSYSITDGRTAPMSIAATMASRKGLFVLNAAGNEGASSWHYVGIPADADSICTVGAIDSLYNVATFSSVGPTYDGRIKPDLVARGVGAWVSTPDGLCLGGNGTSFATPILAGAVACFMNAHQSYSNMKLLDTLKRTASNHGAPDNSRGWGTPNMCAFPVGIRELKADSSDFEVYPNPFNSFITINLIHSNYTVILAEIKDVFGKTVLKEIPKTGVSNFNLMTSELPSGIYFIRLTTSEGSMTKKIIK